MDVRKAGEAQKAREGEERSLMLLRRLYWVVFHISVANDEDQKSQVLIQTP